MGLAASGREAHLALVAGRAAAPVLVPDLVLVLVLIQRRCRVGRADPLESSGGSGATRQLVLGECEEFGQTQAQGAGSRRKDFGGTLLASSLQFGEVGHRDPGRVRDVLEGAFLCEPFTTQHAADDVAPEWLPLGRAQGRLAQGDDTGRVGRLAAHLTSVGSASAERETAALRPARNPGAKAGAGRQPTRS